jgi:hypothetical protein
MWFGKRRTLTSNLAVLLDAANSTADKLVNWMRTDGALIRYALRHGGDADLILPNDDLRLLLAEQLAAVLMAKQNLMLLQGRRHRFRIGPIYVPVDPEQFEECVAKIWAHTWPDCRYPRYGRLTPEERYLCFGPGGRSRSGPPEETQPGEPTSKR